METIQSIPPEVAAIIPVFQLKVTKENLSAFIPAIERLEIALNNCPKLYETDGKKEHPAIFHYFYGGSDMYICEYDREEGLFFGYSILNADLQNSEWGYFSVQELASSKFLNIDYYFDIQTIEAALYKAYPKHFKKPQSLSA